MTDDDNFTWPDADLAWHAEFDSDRNFSVEHGIRVFVFKDVERLQRAVRNDACGAYSQTYSREDDAGVQATIFLAEPVEMSSVVHEVTHVALLWHRPTVRRKQRALSWLQNHPESIAELVGNASAIIWHNIPLEHRAS